MKRNVKRILVILLLFVSFFVVGCGSTVGADNPSAPVTPTAQALDNEKSEAVHEKEDKDIQNQPTGNKETGNTAEKDKYKTEPVPVGKPVPVEPQDIKVDKKTPLYCTLSIECNTILDHMEDLTSGKETLIPGDGVIMAAKKVEFYQGESVFDVLLRETKNDKIHMEFVNTPMYNSAYIEGIHNLYEFDCGALSGWMYKVNDWYPNYGCSRYTLEDGDVVEWNYTCDLGRDIGGGTYQ